MSRSAKFPLLRTLLRAANKSQLSEQQLEQRIARDISRRDFLKSSALVAGISAIDVIIPNIGYSQRKGKPRIVIVGAGLAGLSAAYELRKKGITAKIYEASQRVGGRVMTANGVLGSSLYTEYGGEFIDTGHEHVLSLVKELGLRTIDVKPESSAHLTDMLYFDGRHYSEQELIQAFKPIASRLTSDAAKIGDKYDSEFSKLDLFSLEQYIWSLEAEPWLKKLITTAFVIEYGLDAGDQSACNMLSMIEPDLNDKPSLYGESDERYRIAGGNDLLAKELATKVGDDLELGHRLVEIKSQGKSYRLTFEKGMGERSVDAEIVIMAIPFSVLRNVAIQTKLPGDKLYAIRTLGYGSNSKVILGVNKKSGLTPWEAQGHNGGLYTDLAIQSGWDSAPTQSDFDSSYTVYLGGSRANITRATSDDALADLERVMPGFNQQFSGTSKTFVWKDYQYSLGSYSAYKPGQWSMQGIEGRTEGNLYFAGEHCSGDYQGFMEGAVETGIAAANAVMKKVKA